MVGDGDQCTSVPQKEWQGSLQFASLSMEYIFDICFGCLPRHRRRTEIIHDCWKRMLGDINGLLLGILGGEMTRMMPPSVAPLSKARLRGCWDRDSKWPCVCRRL